MTGNYTDSSHDRQCRIVAENALECIWTYDISAGKFTFVSPAVSRLNGFSVEEAMRKSFAETLSADSLKRANDIIKLLISRYQKGEREDDRLTYTGEFEIICNNHTTKQARITGKLIRNDESGAMELLGIATDITQQKQLEQQLRQTICDNNETIQQLRDSEKAFKELTKELDKKNKILRSHATRDGLTGIYNRYYFDQKIMEEIGRSQRYQHPLSVMLFDIDFFKQVNDTYGHQAGDHVLVSVADTVHKNIRTHDIFARWGGDEFILLMPQTVFSDAVTAAEKLRQKIVEIRFAEIPSQVSASFGVIELMRGEAEESWFKRVDYALFCSKNAGKNRVTGISWEDAVPFVQIKLEWKPEWECGNATIDNQHKELLNQGNKLLFLAFADMQSETTEKTLETLISHVQAHFTSEEEILRELGYPGLDEHAEIHRSLIQHAQELEKMYQKEKLTSSSIFSFLLDEVVMGHLLKEDIRFFPYIKAKLSQQCSVQEPNK